MLGPVLRTAPRAGRFPVKHICVSSAFCEAIRRSIRTMMVIAGIMFRTNTRTNSGTCLSYRA